MKPIVLKIYIPYSDDPLKPLEISVKQEAKVEDVIGYTLYEYFNEDRVPAIDADLCDIVYWNLRIVEDDGSVKAVPFNE